MKLITLENKEADYVYSGPEPMRCFECGEIKDKLVCIGEIPGWETLTTYVCLECLTKAVELLNK